MTSEINRYQTQNCIETMASEQPVADGKAEHQRLLAEALERKRHKWNNTGLLVLKGAVVEVLGKDSALTTSIAFASAAKGTLQVRYTPADKPSDEQLKQIEAAANRVIRANAAVCVFELPRAEAEAKYAEPVNSIGLYHEVQPAADVSVLSIVEIENVAVNVAKGWRTESYLSH